VDVVEEVLAGEEVEVVEEEEEEEEGCASVFAAAAHRTDTKKSGVLRQMFKWTHRPLSPKCRAMTS
jgi:hypothetical protein